jgi:L-amino acid N-acyltransferase YncA
MTLALRPATPDDATALAAIYAPYVLTSPATFELIPPDAAEMRRRLVKVLEKFPWLVAEEAGEVVGYAYAHTHRERAAYQWSAEVSAYLRQDRHRRGIGRVLYAQLFEILRRQGYVNAFAGITLPNPGSVGMHEAMGFELIGVFRDIGYKGGAWHDVGWYQFALRPRPDTPAPPTPWPEVNGAPR